MPTVVSIPPFLLAELRIAFQSCRTLRRSNVHRPFTYRASQLSEAHPKSHPTYPSGPTTNELENRGRGHVSGKCDLKQQVDDVKTTELVPQKDGRRSVGAGRSVDVPLKVVPKAELLSPKLRLTPRERLHIEALTRRAPRKTEKKIYKERLLIYHQGTPRETALIFSKILSFAGLSINSLIVVPALYMASTPIWICAACLLGGFVPISAVHALTAPMVNRIYLHLPNQARESPQAAMEYARDLPNAAKLDIEYLRPIPLASSVPAYLADLEASPTRWRPATFKWKEHRADPGPSWLWPRPLEFFVQPESHKGKAARYTVPGIWPNVYKRLTGKDVKAVSRWKR